MWRFLKSLYRRFSVHFTSLHCTETVNKENREPSLPNTASLPTTARANGRDNMGNVRWVGASAAGGTCQNTSRAQRAAYQQPHRDRKPKQ